MKINITSISLLYLLVLVMMFAGPGCSSDKDNEDEKTKYSAVDDSDVGFDKEMMDQLNELGGLEAVDRQTRDPKEKIKINQKRTELADKLLQNKNLTEQYRVACVMAKAQSLLRRIALNDQPDVLRKELIRFSDKHSIDTNPEVVRIAKTSKISLQAADLINNKLENTDTLVSGVVELVDMYPDHPVTSQEVFGLIDRFWRTQNRDVAVQLMQQITPVLKRNENEVNQKIVKLCESRMLLARHGFMDAVDQQVDSKSGTINEFQDAISKTLSDPDFSDTEYAEIPKSITRLEITNQYQALVYLYNQMQQHLGKSANTALKKQAVEDAEKGMRRISLINKPFQMDAVDLQGQPIQWQQFNGKPMIVIFISIAQKPTLDALGYLEVVHNELAEQGVNMIVACVNDNRQAIARTFAKSKGKWVAALNPTDSTKPKLAEAFGIQQMPFIFLVSGKGIVTEINIPPTDIKDKATQLMFSSHWKDSSGGRYVSRTQLPAKLGMVAAPGFSGLGLMTLLQPRHEIYREQDEQDDANVYVAPAHLTTKELVDYILDLDYKPRSIQQREAYVEAIHDTAIRIIEDNEAKAAWQRIAALTCARHLQARAALGDDSTDEKLTQWVKRIKSIDNKAVQSEVEFLELEQSLLKAEELDFADINSLLEKVNQYCETHELEEKHLRMASLTVQLINRIDRESHAEDDAKTRTKLFESFGNLFAKSEDKRLARYGKSLAKTSSASSSNWVGKPLELAGTNLDGQPFAWDSYRGKVVLVDFWATWCGPCRKSMPAIAELYQELKDSGFEVVGVSLDADPETARKYAEENGIQWEHVGGDEAKNAAETYGVSAIPTLMLVDAQGNITAIDHNLAKLKPQIVQLLDSLNKR